MTGKATQLAFLMLFAATALVLTGCVKKVTLSEEGQKVEFVENADVIKDKLTNPDKCKLVITLNITAQGSTGLMAAKAKEEAADRLIRARNAAAREGANVLIAVGELKERTQTYEAYKCN